MKTTSVYILGQQGTGKTTILNQLHAYFRSEFPDATKMTSRRLEIAVNEARFVFSVVNLPMALSSIYLYKVSKGDKFILVYAVDDHESFEYIESIKDFLVSRRGEGVPVTVLGNKNDLSQRALRYELVDCLVSIDWDMKYIEMSALRGDCAQQILKFLLPRKENVPLLPPKDDSNPFGCPPPSFRQRSNTDSDIENMMESQTPSRRESLAFQSLLPRKDGKTQQKSSRRFSLPNFSLALHLSKSRSLGDTDEDTTLVDGNIGPDLTLYENREEIETTARREQSEMQLSLRVDPPNESYNKDHTSRNFSPKRKRSSLFPKLICFSNNKEW